MDFAKKADFVNSDIKITIVFIVKNDGMALVQRLKQCGRRVIYPDS
jgi:hypothetical protein